MLELETSLSTSDLVESVNIAELLMEGERRQIALLVQSDFDADVTGREDWERKMKGALELALQVTEPKSFPWQGAANVKFPIITIAALQFHSRAYPAMVPGPDLVRCRTFGPDPTGEKEARATRVANHMSYQILEEDESWEEDHDRVLLTVPIIGCAFKKIYFNQELGHNVSEYVPAKDIYIPYFAKSVEAAARWTHVVETSKNELISYQRRGFFCEQEPLSAPVDPLKPSIGQPVERMLGTEISPRQEDLPYELLEQHRYLDLDGDGYEEPYIVTMIRGSGQLCRIVARYTSQDVKRNSAGEIYSITCQQNLQKYSCIPSPDGGIYDLGFGILLQPLNDSINTIINQLLDAGTLANTAGGFLGRGAKIRSGDTAFSPFEWKRVDSLGDDLRKSIIPLDVREPSAVLFQLLGLLIDYSERVAGSMESQVGISPGQNTPAETTRTVVAEGQKVFIGIFKRLYRAMKGEFRKLYNLNQVYLQEGTTVYYDASGQRQKILSLDYLPDAKTVCPMADPNMVTDMQRIQQAQFLKQSAMTTAGYDLQAVERRFLEALKISDIRTVYPGPDKVPPLPNAKLEIEKMKVQERSQAQRMEMQMAALQLLGEAELNQARVQELRAKAVLHLSQADGVKSGHEIALLEAQIGAAKAHQESLLKSAQLILDSLHKSEGRVNDARQSRGTPRPDGGGNPGMAEPPSNQVLQGLLGGQGEGDAGGLG